MLFLVSLNFILSVCVQCFIMGITLMVCYETKNKTKLYCIYAFSNKLLSLHCLCCCSGFYFILVFCFSWFKINPNKHSESKCYWLAHRSVISQTKKKNKIKCNVLSFRRKQIYVYVVALLFTNFFFGNMKTHSQIICRYLRSLSFVNAQFTFLKPITVEIYRQYLTRRGKTNERKN